MAQSRINIEWEAHEYEHKERSTDWFWAVGIISVALAITSIIFGNIILGILILVAAFSLTLFANRHPRVVNVSVNDHGITVEKTHYPFSTLKSYWIDTQHSHPKIILHSEKFFMPLVIVPLGEEVNVDDLHEILSHFLQEEFHSLPFVEKILERLGF